MRRPDELRDLVEARLGSLVFSRDLGALEEALRYSLLAGGKRIRPVLCLAAGEALGRKPEELMPAACALELVHTFSLVHDDLPALDDDDLRRGRPSAHVRFGEDVAILAGDALLAEAFRLALTYPVPDVARVLAEATLGMIGGQYLDVTTDGELDAAALAELHALKTGRLIRASVLAATAVAGLDETAREPWAALGADIGLLFQIVDDVLDATATTEELGKTAGKDAAAGKVTYVSLHGLARAQELADEVERRVLERLEDLQGETSVLREIVVAVRTRHA
jgi:geranylgeranyl diphosphate synthase type II